jgi:hypothetical protein
MIIVHFKEISIKKTCKNFHLQNNEINGKSFNRSQNNLKSIFSFAEIVHK